MEAIGSTVHVGVIPLANSNSRVGQLRKQGQLSPAFLCDQTGVFGVCPARLETRKQSRSRPSHDRPLYLAIAHKPQKRRASGHEEHRYEKSRQRPAGSDLSELWLLW